MALPMVAAIGVGSLALSPSAMADTTHSPASAAAGWLARQLTDGDHMVTVVSGTSYPDQGLTGDVVLALDAAKVAQDAAAKATTWLAGPDVLSGYVGDGKTESYAGAHAKVALVAQAQGLDPTSFGGVNLITALQALQTPSGRYRDKSAYGDYSNGITQALAVLALHRQHADTTAGASYLAGTECSDGGFPLYLEQKTCSSDVDTTGFVVQALLATGQTAAANKALDWLTGVQKADGGFAGSGPTSGENANSTGPAAAALRAGGRAAAADKAGRFLASLQVGCTGASANQGAIAYDTTGFNAGNAARATAQAVPAVAGVSLADVSATGATSAAPTLDCTTPTGTPTSTSATTQPTSSTATPAALAADSTGTGGPQLANTGVSVGGPLAIAALLLLAGVGVLVLVRRRSRA